MPFKHNKRRNTGLVYEFLVRRAASYIIDNDKDGCQRVVEIIQRQFGRTAMGAELALFEVFRRSRGMPEVVARKILADLAVWSKKINPHALSHQKGNLLKEINYTFGKRFFDEHRVPEYRVFASLQLFLDSCRSDKKRLDESSDHVKLEEGLVMFMMSSEPVKADVSNRDVDELVCALAVKDFREKYGNSMTPGQREMLERYTKSIISDRPSSFVKYLNERRLIFLETIRRGHEQKEFKEDRVMNERLLAAKSKLLEMVIDEKVNLGELTQDMMLYDKLFEEINNV
jgi:hypothetical protein